jgi:tetratricopeptide (TPR) repeat protein
MRRALVAVPCLLLLGVSSTRPAAPPVPPGLRPEDHRQIASLRALLDQQVGAGRFEEAARAARQIADLRRLRQGVRHWQTIDARLDVEDWDRLAKVPARQRDQVRAAFLHATEAQALGARRQYERAAHQMRQALTIWSEALGEAYPHTVVLRNELAFFLNRQGKHAQARPLYEKALAIRRRLHG